MNAMNLSNSMSRKTTKPFAIFSRLASGLIAIAVASNIAACSDIVVKVDKKGRNADLSGLESKMSLSATEDFLKHIDNLKVIASDMLVKELASNDYVGNFRKSFRKYRQFIIERGENYQMQADSFYAGDSACRDSGLKVNMNELDDALGMIARTAVLAKISEASASKLNPAISKEMAAIGQLILRELGLEVVGQSQVDQMDDATITSSQVVMRLKAIPDEKVDGEPISEALKAKDAAETLTLQFTRNLGAENIGHFDARIIVQQLIDAAAGTTRNVIGTVTVDRFKDDSGFVHTAFMTVAKEGSIPHFSRMLSLRQVDGADEKVEIVDTLNAGLDGQASYATVLDLVSGSQCKVSSESASDLIEEIGNPLEKTPESDGSDKTIVTIDDQVGKPTAPAPTEDPVTTTEDSPVQKLQTPVQK